MSCLNNRRKPLPRVLVPSRTYTLRFTKSLLCQRQAWNVESIMEIGDALEAMAHLTEDYQQGVNALLEKRAPDFQGR